MNERRKSMLKWAVENIEKWPVYPEDILIDTSEIRASFRYPYGDNRHLPMLHCDLGGGSIDSFDWFYARRKRLNKIKGEK